MLRGIAGSLLSLVVLATFLWGGCVSCEQYFMFPGKHQPCCNKSGQCERPGTNSPKPQRQDCNRLPMQLTATAHIPLPALLPAPIATATEMLPGSLFHEQAFGVPQDTSPPNVQALHSTFLI